MTAKAPFLVTLTGPLLITLGYFAFYYLAMINVLLTKVKLRREHTARGERFDRYASSDRRMLAADRVQLNTLEHMPPFLTLLWLDAAFASPRHATIAGALYLATRCLYPFVLGATVDGDAPRRVVPLTFTGYGALAFLTFDLLRVVCLG